MSIPTNQLVYAGIWNATTRYPQYQFVVSPVDGQCYINTSAVPVTGGSDPSVQPSATWTLFPNVTGDITGITAGTGITGGGTMGNVTISNTGVLTVSAGNGLAYSGSAQNPVLSNNGVLSVGAGTGLASTGGQNPVLSNSGVLSVGAGTGIASTGGQNPSISNTGVLSLDAQTGSVTTKCGQWYKTAAQTVVKSGSPTTTTVTWDAPASWSDVSTLTYDAGNQLFVVNQHGIYHLQCQVQYSSFDTVNFGDNTHLININITRTIAPPDPNAGTYANSPIRVAFDWDNSTPTIPDNFVAGIYELQVGDKLQIQLVDDINSGTFDIKQQSGGGNSYDYNTFFTWSMIKPLP